ncbi:hypothetical protein Poli38472_005463 [Pythium oligandrum]|uniref:50S ribosomal protein L9, chloroplastic n=1 Tax=Pythium oligandrum TaxID=41045 RepID=A0A8K1CGK3_PYTOL|nr:hypothetical protein Poli38472_005463 [Pythium oligandrum]|eukprot:TMW62845.1 hypothetical protein Poli38472_005463 [Pythium oligandrum]
MSDTARLRKLRSSNSKLMKGNLSLLMSIREADTEIHQQWQLLQQYCEQLEREGLPIPPSCVVLMGGQVEGKSGETKQATNGNEMEVGVDAQADSPSSATSDRSSSTALSMRNMLNDDATAAFGWEAFGHDEQIISMLAATSKHVRACLRKQDNAAILTRAFGHRVSMVLKEDVANLGYRGDEVSVKAGFARNFLYPQKLAVYATEANRVKYKVDRESLDEVDAEKERAVKQVVDRLSASTVYFKRYTASKTEQTLHTCVTAQEISDALEKQLGIIVGVARIDLPTPIKTLGAHLIKIRVDDEVTTEVANAEKAANGEELEMVDTSKKQIVQLDVQVVRR